MTKTNEGIKRYEWAGVASVAVRRYACDQGNLPHHFRLVGYAMPPRSSGSSVAKPMARKAPTERKLGRPAQSDPAVTREKILSAASYLLAHRGYRGTTMKLIGDRANLTSGAIYHHFSSKEELYRAIGEHGASRMSDAYDNLQELPPAERIKGFLAFMLDDAPKNLEEHRLGVTSVADAEQWDVVHEIRDQWQVNLQRVYRQIAAPDADENNILTDDEREAVALMELVSLGFSFLAVNPNGLEKLGDAVKAFVRLLDGQPLLRAGSGGKPVKTRRAGSGSATKRNVSRPPQA